MDWYRACRESELTVDLIMNEAPLVDPQPFRFSRFSDGSQIHPIIGI